MGSVGGVVEVGQPLQANHNLSCSATTFAVANDKVPLHGASLNGRSPYLVLLLQPTYYGT